MADDNTIEIQITGNSENAQQAIGKVNDSLKSLQSETGNTSGAMKDTGSATEGLTGKLLQMAAAYVGVNMLEDMAKASMEDEDAQRKLTMAMQAAGITSEGTKQALFDFSAAMADQTTYSKDQIDALMALGLNYGITQDKIEAATKGAIGLATTFAGSGLSVDSAMRMVANANEGQYSALTRYIPALRTAESQSEKFAIVQKAMADGFTNAQSAVNTTGGALTMMGKAVHDLASSFGDILIPIIKGVANLISGLAGWLQKMPDFWKLMVIGGIAGFAVLTGAAMAFGATLTVSTAGVSLLIGALVAGAAWVATNWDVVKEAFEKLFINLKIWGFEAVKFMSEKFGWFVETTLAQFNLIAKGINAVFKTHIQLANESATATIDSCNKQILAEQKKMAELEVMDKKRLAAQKKNVADTKGLNNELEGSEKHKMLTIVQLEEEKWQIWNNTLQLRKDIATAEVDSFIQSATAQKATLKSVSADMIKAIAQMFAKKLEIAAIADIAMLNFVGGAAEMAAAAGVILLGNAAASGITAMAGGGIISEPIMGMGVSGRRYLFGENGNEVVTPMNNYNNNSQQNSNTIVVQNLNLTSSNAKDMMSQLQGMAKRSNARIFKR